MVPLFFSIPSPPLPMSVVCVNARMLTASRANVCATGITGGNPVVDELLKWRPDIKFPEADLKGDVATLLGARYLVQGVSSFSVTLAAMSDRLIRTYIPRQVIVSRAVQFIRLSLLESCFKGGGIYVLSTSKMPLLSC